jgi:hypothetical protein
MYSNPYLIVIIAGACAGAWPLVMQKSGLPGPLVALVYSLCSLAAAGALCFLGGVHSLPKQDMNWFIAIIAASLAAAALLLLSGVIEKVSARELSLLYVIMLLMQIAVPVIVFIAVNKGVSLRQGAGLTLAVIAALLLK